ncbi:MAG: hypothetical protein LBD48_05830 [Treponema sp.]|jgi:hypothetical protein|nr:hypothetical protein [Treponema sp.]
MKKTVFNGKIALLCVVFFLYAGLSAFAQVTPPGLGDLQKSMDEFSGNLAKSLPFNASMGLNWSEAHIKKFPHFGAGASLGFTTMESGAFGELLDQFGFSLPVDLGGFPVPGYAIEGRMGGFFLPFDVGFKFGLMPMKPNGIKNWDYFLIGGDIRYAVVQENMILPMVSVGLGFNYLSGALGMSAGSDRSFDFVNPNGNTPASMTLKAPDLTVNWSTATIDMKAQISKTFILLTPYFGVGASNGWSKAGYNVETTITTTGATSDEAKEAAKKLGIDLNNAGFSSSETFTGWSFRMYGGFSFNLMILRIDLTGLFNFVDQNYGVSLGFRVQM